MNRALKAVACFLLCLAWAGGREAAAQKADAESVFRAGAAASNITPPLGEPIVGGWRPRPATYIHDELHARCLVLDDGTTKLAIVLCDNVGIPREVYDAAKAMAHKATGIPPEHMLTAATHTHSATSARTENKMVRAEKLGEYQRFLARRIADGIRRAVQNLEPARIGWGSVDEPSQVFNRRWHLVKGDHPHLRNPFGGVDEVRMNPPRGHSTLLKPAGPIDPQISFVSVQSKEGRPIALLANYSLHYVGGVPGGHVSADYFAVFARRIAELLDAEKLDPPFVGILSNGTSGDINNINFREKGRRSQPYEKMRQVGRLVANRVHEAHRTVEFHDWVPLAAVQTELALAVRKPTDGQLAWAKQTLARPDDAEAWHIRERIYARRVQQLAEAPDEVSIILQTFRIGGVGIAAIPFEVFVESGLEIKEKSPFPLTFTIELANGSYGYLPTPRHHELGGYETWLGTNAVEKQASEKIVARLLEMFGRLKQDSSAR